MIHDQVDQAFDARVLDELRQFLGAVDGGLVSELIALFFQEARILLEEMSVAALAGEAAGVARAAHCLRGSAGHIGAHGVVAICAEIERRAAGGALDGLGELLGQLQTMLDALERRLAA